MWVANQTLPKKKNRKQRSWYVSVSEAMSCFHGVCNARSTTVFEDKRKRRRLAQTVSGEVATNQAVKMTKKPYTLYCPLHSFPGRFFFSTSGRLQKNCGSGWWILHILGLQVGPEGFPPSYCTGEISGQLVRMSGEVTLNCGLVRAFFPQSFRKNSG